MTTIRWKQQQLLAQAKVLVGNWTQRFQFKGDKSLFWVFFFDWKRQASNIIQAFCEGTYRTLPLKKFHFEDETVLIWSFVDRLIQKLLLKLIAPTFKHVISPFCFHTKGPSGVKPALALLQRAMNSNKYHYLIRADVKGYYAHIQHDILIKQLCDIYQDPRLQNYFAKSPRLLSMMMLS